MSGLRNGHKKLKKLREDLKNNLQAPVSMEKKFFVTTAIDYANDVIHIGHSYQKLLADVLARYHRLRGDQTFFLTGSDEHGQKVEKSALRQGKEPQIFVDEIITQNKKEWQALNLSYDRFIRTTDPDHIKVVQEFYLKAKKNGDIYPGLYEGFYCEGCETYLNENELQEGKCPLHPFLTPKKIKENNYFFRLSRYQKFLENYLEKHPDFVWPESKRNEALSLIKSGLKDFSVSRQGTSWGIPVPDDPSQTIYVWFDALINYYTFGSEKKCWPADVHILGKDNLKFHAVYWPAMLKSAGLSLPKTILVHHFISLNGQKISKSLGNVIRPSELTTEFGPDAVRYYFLRYGPLNNDVDISQEKLKDVYNADLANGLGNLIARVARLTEIGQLEENPKKEKPHLDRKISEYLDSFRVDLALEYLWGKIAKLDLFINKNKLWSETKDKKSELLFLTKEIKGIAFNLSIFLPETAEKIEKQFNQTPIKPQKPLFPRLNQ